MNTVALTPKQEKFCRCIVSGMDGKASYMAAYDTNASDQVIRNEANKLLQRDDITERIAELSKPLQNHARNTAISARQQQIDFINERIAICKQKEDEQSIIRYTDMLNKINALYKDTEETKQEQNTVVNLDMDTLRKLSGDV